MKLRENFHREVQNFKAYLRMDVRTYVESFALKYLSGLYNVAIIDFIVLFATIIGCNLLNF